MSHSVTVASKSFGGRLVYLGAGGCSDGNGSITGRGDHDDEISIFGGCGAGTGCDRGQCAILRLWQQLFLPEPAIRLQLHPPPEAPRAAVPCPAKALLQLRLERQL